jgi:L-lysine exporter family protein LysE/ArgO
VTSWLYGFVTGLGLIVAIGAQNAFVLRAGIGRRQVFAVAITPPRCDAALITVGGAGVGTALAASPTFAAAMALGGAAFLIVYGVSAIRSALRRTATDWGDAPGLTSARAAVAATLAVSLLNPHVYLDTVVLLGGIGGQLPGSERVAFALGAIGASLGWFFALAFGARALAPAFARPGVARALDLFVAAVLFTVAISLVRGVLAGVS